ncbi:MAG: transposase [Spirosomataceae bacterium]|jgi:REP element-mobilizing transposase RayT
MDKYKNKYRIPSARLRGYDYASEGAYFITICTHNREHFFGEIADGKMHLNEIGKLAEKYWAEIPDHFPDVELGNFVIMPNHTHGILIIKKSAGNDISSGDEWHDGNPNGQSNGDSDGQSDGQSDENSAVQTLQCNVSSRIIPYGDIPSGENPNPHDIPSGDNPHLANIQSGDIRNDNISDGRIFPYGDNYGDNSNPQYISSRDIPNPGDIRNDNISDGRIFPYGDNYGENPNPHDIPSGDHPNPGDIRNDNIPDGRIFPAGENPNPGDIRNENNPDGKFIKNEKMAEISPKSGSISTIIRSYKSAVTKYARAIHADFEWQTRFHDHIIRDAGSFERIQTYIENNPLNWKEDKFS